MSILSLLQESTKTVKFRDGEVTVRKLPTRVIIELSSIGADDENESTFQDNVEIMSVILVNGVVEFDADDMLAIQDASQELFTELAKLQTEVMEFSGLSVPDSEE